jgi:hypothetical protein
MPETRWVNAPTYRTCPLPQIPLLEPIKNNLTGVKSRLYEVYKKPSLRHVLSDKKRWLS